MSLLRRDNLICCQVAPKNHKTAS